MDRLVKSNCIVLFATHFHELSLMQNTLSGVQNLSVNAYVPPSGKEIVMLYEVQNGPCAKSYGIEVAKIAKFPYEIIQNALAISSDIEARVTAAQI